MEVTVFTLTGCGRCVVIKKKLQSMGIPYEEKNCSDNPGVAKVLGLHSFPSLMVDGKIMAYTAAAAWIREQDL